MKPELNITEARGPVAGTDLDSLRVECVFCDERGEPVRRGAVALLSLLGPRRRMLRQALFAEAQG